MYIGMVIFKKNIMMKNQKFCVACVGYPYPWTYGPVWPSLAICLLANLAALFLRTTTQHTIATTIAIIKTTPQILKMMMHV